MANTNNVADRIELAVSLLCNGNRDHAASVLASIDRAALARERAAARDAVWGPRGVARGYKSSTTPTRRTSVRATDQREVFLRDRYTCRYRHCGRKVIDLRVLKLLSKALPDILPYHPNWKPLEDHIVYWTFSASLEHMVPFPEGGSSSTPNLITACYQCNDLKNRLPISIICWEVAERAGSGWDGLVSRIAELKRAVAEREND
jgi:5-methylcytosine-specific restriction endonuclease McrA